MRVMIIIWGAVLLLASAVQAGQSHLTRTEDLLRQIGVDAYLVGFAEQIGGADNPMAQSVLDLSDAWTASARVSFAPDDMLHEIAEVMATRLAEDELAALEMFYDSALGRAVTDMEVAAQVPGLASQVKTEGADLLRDLIARDDPRLRQLTALIDALSAVETGVEMAVNLNQAVVSGMVASGRMPFALSGAQIETLVRSQAGLMRGTIREQLFVSLVYTYQSLPDEDLDRYVAFLSSDAGSRFYVELLSAKSEVVGKRARSFGVRLMKLHGTKAL